MASKKPRKLRSSLREQQLGLLSTQGNQSADELERFVLAFACEKNHKPGTVNALMSRLRFVCEFIKEHHQR